MTPNRYRFRAPRQQSSPRSAQSAPRLTVAESIIPWLLWLINPIRSIVAVLVLIRFLCKALRFLSKVARFLYKVIRLFRSWITKSHGRLIHLLFNESMIYYIQLDSDSAGPRLVRAYLPTLAG